MRVLAFGTRVSLVAVGLLTLAPASVFSQNATTAASRCFTYDDPGRLNAVGDGTGDLRSYALDPASNRQGVTSSSGQAPCPTANIPLPSQGAASAPLANNPPSAPTLSVTLSQWETATVTVMPPAVDPEGDAFEVSGATYNSSLLQVTRVRANPQSPYKDLDIVGVAPGTTSVNYTVTDASGATAIGLVSVTVLPSANGPDL